ncbi:hypothetical protein C8Q78DRAFT_673515 [Trametes maxima]|nr:hypothetical protein C8Q78DRAFT_673515 [Trametes maxima]
MVHLNSTIVEKNASPRRRASVCEIFTQAPKRDNAAGISQPLANSDLDSLLINGGLRSSGQATSTLLAQISHPPNRIQDLAPVIIPNANFTTPVYANGAAVTNSSGVPLTTSLVRVAIRECPRNTGALCTLERDPLGAVFHYDMTTPTQLTRAYVLDHLSSDFPLGSLGMRPTSITDPSEIFEAYQNSLLKLFERFPQSVVVLVGDTPSSTLQPEYLTFGVVNTRKFIPSEVQRMWTPFRIRPHAKTRRIDLSCSSRSLHTPCIYVENPGRPESREAKRRRFSEKSDGDAALTPRYPVVP